jgi:hypothetical protein
MSNAPTRNQPKSNANPVAQMIARHGAIAARTTASGSASWGYGTPDRLAARHHALGSGGRVRRWRDALRPGLASDLAAGDANYLSLLASFFGVEQDAARLAEHIAARQ